MKGAVVQFNISSNQKENLEKAYTYAKMAKKEEVDILSFAEFFSYPWFVNTPDKDLEIFNNDTTIPYCINIAKSLKLYLVISYFEIDKQNHYNSCLLIDPRGTIIGKYRKNHIPDLKGFYERKWYESGDIGVPVFQTEIGKIGILICSDAMFLECAHILLLKGAEIIFIPRAVVTKGRYRWNKMLIANSILTGCYVFSANRMEKYNSLDFDGRSMIIEPGGKKIKEAQGDEEILITECDLKKVKEAQLNYPCLVQPNINMYLAEYKGFQK